MNTQREHDERIAEDAARAALEVYNEYLVRAGLLRGDAPPAPTITIGVDDHGSVTATLAASDEPPSRNLDDHERLVEMWRVGLRDEVAALEPGLAEALSHSEG